MAKLFEKGINEIKTYRYLPLVYMSTAILIANYTSDGLAFCLLCVGVIAQLIEYMINPEIDDSNNEND